MLYEPLYTVQDFVQSLRTPCEPSCGLYAVWAFVRSLRRASLRAVFTPCEPSCGLYAVWAFVRSLRRASLRAVSTPCEPSRGLYAVWAFVRSLRRASLRAVSTPYEPSCGLYAVRAFARRMSLRAVSMPSEPAYWPIYAVFRAVSIYASLPPSVSCSPLYHPCPQQPWQLWAAQGLQLAAMWQNWRLLISTLPSCRTWVRVEPIWSVLALCMFVHIVSLQSIYQSCAQTLNPA